MANTAAQAEEPFPQLTTWDRPRRWSAVFGLTAAVAMGSASVACGSHGATDKSTTTTTTPTTHKVPGPADHWHHSDEPRKPAPSGTSPRTTGTQPATSSPPVIPGPILPGPGDYSPFGNTEPGGSAFVLPIPGALR